VYGQVLGVSTGGTGAVTLAALPETGGLRVWMLVYGVTAVIIGAVTITTAAASIIRGNTAKKRG
jgi:hypothetical protein